MDAFRAATGWDAPPLRLEITKRIPVAAGLAGGSADAAAALRLARHVSGLGDEALLRELGAVLGADVPAQIAPARWLATGAGERLQELPDASRPFGVLVLPVAAELSTATVYAEADRLGLGRAPQELEQRRRALTAALELGAPVPTVKELLHNDLQPAAISLCPAISDALDQAREAGAEEVLVSGSGPTVVGLFLRANGLGRAERAAAALATDRSAAGLPAPVCATTVDAAFARVTSGVSHNWAEHMSRTDINYLVGGCAGVFALALYAGLILVPAWTAYSRLWERVAASILSLYVLAVFVGIGVAGALAVLYYWG